MRLLIFTQKVDKNDTVLGFFHNWIVEFASRCESVTVICLYKGLSELPNNVEVYSLGKEGGQGRVSQLITVYRLLFKLHGKYDTVFVHMNPIYLVLCGFYFKVKKIPVYMWYVHRKVDLKLKIATFFSKKIFTSAKESFLIETDKVYFVGHGINMTDLPQQDHSYSGGVVNISHIGRVTPIKGIETLLLSGYELKKKGLYIRIRLLGECVTESDKEYKEVLLKIIREKNLENEVSFEGGFKHREMPKILEGVHINVNLTPPGGMDKVVLESLALGIPSFASNTAFAEVFHKYKNMFMFSHGRSDDLANKIFAYINDERKDAILKEISGEVRSHFDLSSLAEKMVNIMK